MLAKRLWPILFLGVAVFYLWGLGSLPLVGPDEPRYAEVAREMLARHDLITPTLGGLPWFEKPPLLYWLIMASYRLLGVSEYAARLAPAITGLLTSAFIYWIGTSIENSKINGDVSERFEPQSGGLARFSTLIWLSSIGPLAMSRGVGFDIILTMTLTGAFACFLAWQINVASTLRSKSSSHSLLFGFYFFLGLSLLAKGLIGIIIPLGVFSLYFLVRRDWPPRNFLKSLWWGIPLTLAVAAVWYGPMAARHGWRFIDQFIVQHHFTRFVSNKYHHPQPFYFYLPVILGLALPWTVVFLASLISSRRWHWRGDNPRDRLRVFCIAWIIVPLVFFSFSKSKLPFYILPVLPAVALLAGEHLVCAVRVKRGDRMLRLTGALLFLIIVAGSLYLSRHSNVPLVNLAAVATPLLIIAGVALIRPQMHNALVVLIALSIFVTSGISLKLVAPAMAQRESVRDLLAAASAQGYVATPVVQLHTIDRTTEFYAAGRLSYGSDGQPIKLEGAAQVAGAAQRSGGLVLCFVPIDLQSQLTTYQSVQTEVIGNNGRLALIAVRSP